MATPRDFASLSLSQIIELERQLEAAKARVKARAVEDARRQIGRLLLASCLSIDDVYGRPLRMPKRRLVPRKHAAEFAAAQADPAHQRRVALRAAQLEQLEPADAGA
jgi:hypothetical protein